MIRTDLSALVRPAARLIVVVVLPTPPFWLIIQIILMVIGETVCLKTFIVQKRYFEGI